jgi:type I restriction enzyme S subunit
MEIVKILKAIDIINDSVSEYEGVRPFLSTGDLNLSTIINLELHTFLEKPSRANLNVSKGDIILARMQGTVKVKVIENEDDNIIVSTGFLVLRPKINADNKFLFHLLKSSTFQNKKDKLCTGATQKAINNSNFEKLEIPLPPLATQQKIAAILDQASAIITNNQAIVEKYDTLTQSLFLEMFGDPVKNEKGWETKTIEQLVSKNKNSIKRGPFGGALKKEIFVNEGYLVYEQYHALNNDFSMARYFIDYKKFEELKGFEVKPKDIIISCSGVYLGKLAIVPENAKKGIINQALLKVTIDESKMTNDFFVFHFSHKNFREKYFDANRGAGIPNFPPMSEFKKFPFISPPIHLQNKFAERVQNIEAQKQQAQLELAKSEALFNSLLQGAFKGELS